MFIYHKAEEVTSEHLGANEGTCIVVYIPPNATKDYNLASLSYWLIPGTGNNN